MLHIEGRRWFRRTAGNTYNTVYIYKDGECIAKLPKEDGYGEYYLQRAWTWLQEHGYIPSWASYGGTQYLREVLRASYSVVDVAREKDL